MITLKTLKDATGQEVFDQVAAHLMKQMKKSSNGNVCVYHSKDGLKCAAGCLIGDDEYDPRFEGHRWDSLALGYALDFFEKFVAVDVPKFHMDLICELQRLHDDFVVEEWKQQLHDLANKFNLSFNPI